MEPRAPSAPDFSAQPERWVSTPSSPGGEVLMLSPNKEMRRERLDVGAVDMSKQRERWADDRVSGEDGCVPACVVAVVPPPL